MKLKLFGKDIFEFNVNRGSIYWMESNSHLKKSKFLPDFYSGSSRGMSSSPAVAEMVTEYIEPVTIGKQKKKIKKETRVQLTPKGVYEMKMLNEKSFTIKVKKKYVNEQIKQFKDKLNLIKLSEGDMTNGIREIASILIRLENRKKYNQFENYFGDYPYTTTTKIDELIKIHSYLKIGGVDQFVADMPKEAISEMKAYEKLTKKLCKKKPVFYIIAAKKDFERTKKRRDPILLAQSPFGHFWQILGAWDKEMLLLEEL